MNNIENIKEDITTIVDAITIDIPVRVTMTSINNAPFEFTPSIDEVGQIILTPVTKDVEFVDANTAVTTEAGEELLDKETTTTVEDDSSSYPFTTKETTIVIQASMLAESDNHDVSADVDEIGQVVLYPLAKENTFISAAIGESLNLVTEEVEAPEEGVAEQDNVDKTSNNAVEEDPKPEIEAEVIKEDFSQEVDEEDVAKTVTELTDNFSDKEGTLEVDDIAEGSLCANILKQHYEVTIDLEGNLILIHYFTKEELTESLDEEGRLNLINRFMRGDIALFSDEGVPSESYIHLNELDSNGYEYYYDEESDAIVTYPAER